MTIEEFFNPKDLPTNFPSQTKITKSITAITICGIPESLAFKKARNLAEELGFEKIFYQRYKRKKLGIITSHYYKLKAIFF